MVHFHGVRMRGVELHDVDIHGELENVVINGVEVSAYVDAELDRRMPERAKMRPDDADGFREAWAVLERLWADTVARAQTFPEAELHRRSATSGRSSRPCATSASPPPRGSAG